MPDISKELASRNKVLLKKSWWNQTPDFTGYNQSVTDCGSQRRHVVVTQQKLIEIASSSSSNWIWLPWETYIQVCVWCSTKTTFNVYVSQRSQIKLLLTLVFVE